MALPTLCPHSDNWRAKSPLPSSGCKLSYKAISAGLEEAANRALPGSGHGVPDWWSFGEHLNSTTAVVSPRCVFWQELMVPTCKISNRRSMYISLLVEWLRCASEGLASRAEMPLPECKDGPGHYCDRCLISEDSCHDEHSPLPLYLKCGAENEELQRWTTPGLWVFT